MNWITYEREWLETVLVRSSFAIQETFLSGSRYSQSLLEISRKSFKIVCVCGFLLSHSSISLKVICLFDRSLSSTSIFYFGYSNFVSTNTLIITVFIFMMRKYNLLNQIRFDVILCGKRTMPLTFMKYVSNCLTVISSQNGDCSVKLKQWLIN